MQANEKSERSSELTPLKTVEQMAVERFGDIEGLALVHKSTLELSKFYANRYGLDATDPEVTLTASALAFARHKEFTLLREIESDLYMRVVSSPDNLSYGEVLFHVTKTAAYRDIYREIDRLHGRCSVYLKELRELAKEQRKRDA
jgi:hypothetical protein